MVRTNPDEDKVVSRALAIDLARTERKEYLAKERRKLARFHAEVAPIFRHFSEVPRTESAFYIEFQALPTIDVKRLAKYYNVTTEWKAFTLLCADYGVNQPKAILPLKFFPSKGPVCG